MVPYDSGHSHEQLCKYMFCHKLYCLSGILAYSFEDYTIRMLIIQRSKGQSDQNLVNIFGYGPWSRITPYCGLFTNSDPLSLSSYFTLVLCFYFSSLSTLLIFLPVTFDQSEIETKFFFLLIPWDLLNKCTPVNFWPNPLVFELICIMWKTYSYKLVSGFFANFHQISTLRFRRHWSSIIIKNMLTFPLSILRINQLITANMGLLAWFAITQQSLVRSCPNFKDIYIFSLQWCMPSLVQIGL